ncbi:aldo/keto reductase [Rhizobium sp. SG570]|uniref:aldo/keto reductase n=1 Tax=Rhizobium sp. SG570 TaxID=2587113 RepID=UPI001FEE4594|nr:aldo/keto reductase [Rhizobium sp. SG570]NRP90032.1 hypothetical protein [Ensifer adhaerens]
MSASIAPFSPDNRIANMRLVAKIEEIASAKGITPAQLVLAWLCARLRTLNAKAVPVPETRKRPLLEENVAAVSITLTEQEMTTLEPLAAAVRGVAV